ncbi:Calcineurin-like phosphoesterase [Caloramator quimbayensis]|uniref:Calcineurin-like phosphoesterase n=1 Tax=Caloramator quimbayensis TaxID=1147123 RepID=A0A1T4Y5P3_9CLOT|nr:metallophosphoesterase [Caloramator quimbayensis]SKA96631.1 Calcineurin-like phosphoesterase [Caloramator quimbayensis]
MEKIKRFLFNLAGEIYIPECASLNYRKIIHISDTPTVIYGSIIRLIKNTKPDILIHTGDVADDIKLQMAPQLINSYRVKVTRFLSSLSPYVKDRIIVVPGNHDDFETLKSINSIEIITEGSILNVDGISIGLSHDFYNLPNECNLYLYGHDKIITNQKEYLNGIDNINIINIEDMNIIKLHYPSGTDAHRTRKKKMGI